MSSNIMFPDSSIINFPPPPPVRIGDEDPNTACFDQAPLGKVCMTVEEDSENICLITASLTQNDGLIFVLVSFIILSLSLTFVST